VSSLRDIGETSAAQSAIAASRRDDEHTRTEADIYRKLDAIVELLGDGDIDRDRMLELCAVLSDHERRDRTYEAELRLDRGDPAEWLARRNEAARREPAIPARGTDGRAPSTGSVVAVDTDPRTGQQRKWRWSPLGPDGG
jgi:hypothetical protein